MRAHHGVYEAEQEEGEREAFAHEALQFLQEAHASQREQVVVWTVSGRRPIQPVPIPPEATHCPIRGRRIMVVQGSPKPFARVRFLPPLLSFAKATEQLRSYVLRLHIV